MKLSACLRFFVEGTYQKGVGRDYEVALAQSSFSEVLSEFLLAMEISLCSQCITYPTDAETKKTVKFFYENNNYNNNKISENHTQLYIAQRTKDRIASCFNFFSNLPYVRTFLGRKWR